MKNIEIAVDFDGTVVAHKYPMIGEDAPHSVEVLKEIMNAGHKIILWTMRGGEELQEAVNWYKQKEIELYGVNRNPTQDSWTDSFKCYAQLYIDDAALGAPLILDENNNRVIDWLYVRKFLQESNLL
jgi:hypothetical protein